MKAEPMPYHLESAEIRRMHLRESLAAQVAELLAERGWTQIQAAQFLGVTQPRISNLVRGQTHKFTLDTLVEWLFALGRTVQLTVAERPAYDADDRESLLQTVAYQTRVLELEPTNATAFGRRASAYERLGELSLALADYSCQIKLAPDKCGALFNRARVHGSAGNTEQALADYAELEARFPDENPYSNRGLLFDRLGRSEEALADFTRAIEREPQRPGPWWNRACLHEKLGHRDEAISDLHHVLEADPGYTLARERLERLGCPTPLGQLTAIAPVLLQGNDRA